MTEGERMVWAAAYVAALDASLEPPDAERVAWTKIMILRGGHTCTSLEEANTASRAMTVEALGYGDARAELAAGVAAVLRSMDVYTEHADWDSFAESLHGWRRDLQALLGGGSADAAPRCPKCGGSVGIRSDSKETHAQCYDCDAVSPSVNISEVLFAACMRAWRNAP